ncbi:MAG: hypothetical protein QOI57_3030 [Rubrobacteraceae bacterium]|nr:hypothetical protein [Rubrobacteraceae bacterium]
MPNRCPQAIMPSRPAERENAQEEARIDDRKVKQHCNRQGGLTHDRHTQRAGHAPRAGHDGT